MSRLEIALERLLTRLDAQGNRFAVVGGIAVSARTEPRFTRDAGVCVAVETDTEAEDLISNMRDGGYLVVAIVEQEHTRRLAAVRLENSTGEDAGVALDLLFASSGIEPEVVSSAEPLDLFEGLVAPVATLPALIALKLLARDDVSRPQDRVDLVMLMRKTTPADLDQVGQLLDLIHDRGYQRGRDLRRDLDGLVSEVAGH